MGRISNVLKTRGIALHILLFSPYIWTILSSSLREPSGGSCITCRPSSFFSSVGYLMKASLGDTKGNEDHFSSQSSIQPRCILQFKMINKLRFCYELGKLSLTSPAGRAMSQHRLILKFASQHPFCRTSNNRHPHFSNARGSRGDMYCFAEFNSSCDSVQAHFFLNSKINCREKNQTLYTNK